VDEPYSHEEIVTQLTAIDAACDIRNRRAEDDQSSSVADGDIPNHVEKVNSYIRKCVAVTGKYHSRKEAIIQLATASEITH